MSCSFIDLAQTKSKPAYHKYFDAKSAAETLLALEIESSSQFITPTSMRLKPGGSEKIAEILLSWNFPRFAQKSLFWAKADTPSTPNFSLRPSYLTLASMPAWKQ